MEEKNVNELPEETVERSEEKSKEPNTGRQKIKITGKERMSRNKFTIGALFIIAAIAIAIAVVLLMGTKPDTHNVLIAKTTIPAGTLLTGDNLNTYFGYRETTDVSGNMILVSEAGKCVNLYSAYTIVQGSDILKTYLTASYDVVTELVPEGKELVAMNYPAVNAAVGYIPKVGDIVRFYGLVASEHNEDDPDDIYMDENGEIHGVLKDRAIVYDLLKNVEIFSLLDNAGNDVTEYNETHINKKLLPSIMIVAASPEQVAQIIEAQAKNSIYFTLMCTEEGERKEQLLAEQDALIRKYRASHNLAESEIVMKEVIVPFSSLSFDNYTMPKLGDVIRITYIEQSKRSVINADGTEREITKTSLVTDPLLAYVKVVDIVDDNGVSTVFVSKDGKVIGSQFVLLLSDIQKERLKDVMAQHKIFVTSMNEIGNVDEGLLKTSIEARLATIEKESEPVKSLDSDDTTKTAA